MGNVDLIRSGPLAGLKRNHYKAIVADCPWRFMTRSHSAKGAEADTHYDRMTLDEIKAMPVKEIAHKDCALFFWTIDTHLKMALDVLDAWGFEYKTRAFVWAKTNLKYPDYPPEKQLAHEDSAWKMGQGFWTRANPEDCWLATTGSPKRLSAGVRRLHVSPVRDHSRKPDEILDKVEKLVGGPYVELFSRTNKPGWDVMGNQTGKFDPLDVEAQGLI